MLIDPKDPQHNDDKAAEARKEAEMSQDLTSMDPPPTYVFSTASSAPSGPPPSFDAGSSSACSSSMMPAAPSQPAMNFVYAESPNSKVKGTWTIDPLMVIATPLLPPEVANLRPEDRKNCYLFSRNGSVEAEITLLEKRSVIPRDVKRKKRTVLVAGSQNGHVAVRVRRINDPTSPTPTPFQLGAASKNGQVKITIPRDFEGPLTLTTHNGSIKISDEIRQRISTDNHGNGTRRCFVGDVSLYVDGEEWAGDVLNAESHNGSVYVNFVDDSPVGAVEGKGKGIFSRMFG